MIVRDSNTPTAAVGQTTTTVNVLEALAIDDTPTPAIGFSGTNPPGLNAGETINITMNVNRISGGQQPYLLDWVITGPGGVNINPAADNCNPVTGTCEATSFVSLAPSGGAPHVDDYMVSLTVTDSLGNSATTGPVTINVDDP